MITTRKSISLIGVLIFLTTLLPAKYHPGIKWREITSDKFIVVFQQEYERDAGYVLETAEQLYKEQSVFWGTEIKGKIRILLTDVYDVSNGSSTFFPFHHIVVYLFAPLPDSDQGNGGEWIRQVLAHELTHSFTTDMGSGFVRFMRKIAGSNPALYPMIYAPGWLIEGLAVYMESQADPGGRLNAAYYPNMITAIHNGDGLPTINALSAESTEWPGPNAKYLLGGGFVQYLADGYGKEKIAELAKTYARYPLPLICTDNSQSFPLSVSRPFERTFGKNLSVLWADYTKSISTQDISPTPQLEIISDRGFTQEFPVVVDNDTIYYVNRNYMEYPGIYRKDLKTDRSVRLLKRVGINGMTADSRTGKIYFSAVDYHKSFFRYSDIYCLDPATGKTKRLTRGKRMFHPVVNGNSLICIKRHKGLSLLVNLDPATGKETVLSKGYTGLAYPEISPDGLRIAVSLKRGNNNWCIAFFNQKGELLNVPGQIPDGCCPKWKTDDTIVFVKKSRNNLQLASHNLLKEETVVFGGEKLPAVRHFSMLPDGKEAIVSFFAANGFDLGKIDMSESAVSRFSLGSVPGSSATVSNETETGAGYERRGLEEETKPNPRRYRFLRDLIPRFYSPYIRSAGDEIQPGVYFFGTDLPEEHFFNFEGYYGFKTDTFNWHVDYTYDGFVPKLTLQYSDFTDLHREGGSADYTHREKTLELVGLYPLYTRNNSRLWWYSSIYFERIIEQAWEGIPQERVQLDLNGIKAGLLYSNAKTYYDSISPADGCRMALTYALDLKALGSDYNIHTAALEYRHYFSLSRPGVLAFRLAVSDSLSDVGRLSFMGGADSHVGFDIAGNNLFDLMRGYPSGFSAGTGGWLLNVEYRIGLFKIERTPVAAASIQRVYLTAFCDTGNMWIKDIDIDPSVSLGLELNLAVWAGDMQLTFCGGAGVGLNPYHKPVFYLRIGNSF